MWGFTRRDAAIAVGGGVVATYVVRLLDRIAPFGVAILSASAAALLAIAAGLGPVRMTLVIVAAVLLAHLVVLVLAFVGTCLEWRILDVSAPKSSVSGTLFMEMAITATALFVLPLEDIARAAQRFRWRAAPKRPVLRPVFIGTLASWADR